MVVWNKDGSIKYQGDMIDYAQANGDKVKKLDRTGEEVFQVEYLDAWPKTVSQVDLNHTTTNATLRVTCEFSYSYWRTIT